MADAHEDIVGTVDAVAAALRSRGYDAFRLPVARLAEVRRTVRASGAEVVFNLVEELEGSSLAEAAVARELERSGAGVTGCPAGAIGLCLDKERTNALLSSRGLPVPRGRVFHEAGPAGGLEYPLIVKCLREDASLGLGDASIVRDEASLRDRVAWVRDTFGQPAIVEEFLEGREFNVAIAGPRPVALPVSEIDFSTMPAGKPRFVSYEAKWQPESVEFRSTVPVCPADLPPATAGRLRRLATRAARLAGCRDAARVDIRTDAAGRPHILEVNPNPDLSPDAGFARAARVHGWSYEDLIERLTLWAWKRRTRAGDPVASRALRG